MSVSSHRTNSDSALHTSVMNPPSGDPFTTGGSALTSHGGRRNVFPYPVPPIEENVLDDGKLLKAWDSKKFPQLSSRPKSCEVPNINVFMSPEQQSTPTHSIPSVLNTGGSLPDLSSLHFPSPLPTPLDQDEPGYQGSLSGCSSTGNLASTLTQLGINAANNAAGGNGAFHHHTPGLLASLQSTLSNPSLQSSLSNPNIQSSFSSQSFTNSLSSASLHSSLSNPSLQSSLGSSPSLPSSLSSQSLHSSHSSSSLQSASSGNPGYSGSASYAPSLSTSPRRRAHLSPLILPMGGDTRRHLSKQFSPTISPTLSSITQGVPLDTSRLPLDQRLPPYPLSQHQTASQTPQQSPLLTQHQPQQQMLRLQQPRSNAQLSQNLLNAQHFAAGVKQEAELQRSGNLPQLQQISHNLSSDLYNDALLNSLLDDSYLSMQLGSKSNQQFTAEMQGDVLSLNHGGLGSGRTDMQATPELVEQTLLNNQNYGCGSDVRQNVPNIILTGDSPPGLSKEIASALSHVPGFEMDPFSLDDPLRIDPLALDMLEGDLMLADPAVEDSFRSDRLK
uniref:CREB-regulated transcription coactivator 2-like n=1 Tax=Doryrhamphus excisus TaxID=161450 RepID=UPI0025AEB4B2|nr:CREB-regulated transcription coactivator 2-like [Doryrhamphus excisus]